MGFFDKFDALFDTKKAYTEDDLVIYFKHEIDATWNAYIGKEKTTTNIKEIVVNLIKKKFSDMHSWNKDNNYAKLHKYSEGVYEIQYKGLITSIKNAYGDYLGEMHYDIVVYTNKYAELVSGDDYKTTIKVW